MPRHDIAIYAPEAYRLYAPSLEYGGGAERQTYLLAKNLARRGFRVAHIVFSVERPVLDGDAPVTLVDHPRPQAERRPQRFVVDAAQVWRSLSRADAEVQVFRGASGVLGVAGAWCRAHRRRLVFAAAHNADFTYEVLGPRDPRTRSFRKGLRTTEAVVVQSADQLALARRYDPRLRHVEKIASFVEPARSAGEPAEAFLWVSRLNEFKLPLAYTELAAAVPEAHFWMIATRSSEPDFAATLAELERRAAALPNLELLPMRSHLELMRLVERSVAIVNTSLVEGMPNIFLEGWARGIPALTLQFDPDGRIAARGLGISAGGSWDEFVAGTRALWAGRSDRGGYGPAVRAHVEAVHGREVGDRWATLLSGGA